MPQNSFMGLKENIMPQQQLWGNVTTGMAPSCHGVERKHNRRRAAPLLFALHKIWTSAPRSCSKFQGARLRPLLEGRVTPVCEQLRYSSWIFRKWTESQFRHTRPLRVFQTGERRARQRRPRVKPVQLRAQWANRIRQVNNSS